MINYSYYLKNYLANWEDRYFINRTGSEPRAWLCQLFLAATHYSLEPVYYSKYEMLDNVHLLHEQSKEICAVLSITVSAGVTKKIRYSLTPKS